MNEHAENVQTTEAVRRDRVENTRAARFAVRAPLCPICQSPRNYIYTTSKNGVRYTKCEDCNHYDKFVAPVSPQANHRH